jgi:hypothetical protein
MCWSNSLKYLIALAVALSLLWVAGCDDVSEIASSVKDAATEGVDTVKESVSEAAKEVKETVQDATDTVSEEAGLAGSMDIKLDSSIQVDACYAKFVEPASGRPGVFQLQSYRDAADESFPSVFVQAQVSAATTTELIGQTLAAQVFVQTAEDGATWHTETDPVQIKIASIEDKMVSAEVVSGALTSTETGASQPIQGTFSGVLQ